MLRASQKSKVFIIAFSVITAILLVAGLLARIKLTEINDENAVLSSEYDGLCAENARLNIEYESSVDLYELEEYAKNVLGMQKPESEKIFYINVETRDKAVVLENSKKTEAVKLAGSIQEYLSELKCRFK